MCHRAPRFSDTERRMRNAHLLSPCKRLHVNPLITEPDTIDIEWGGAFSTGGGFTMPAVIHYTREGSQVWWGRTAFSASFDSLAYETAVTHFGDRACFAATCVLLAGKRLDLAIEPQAAVLVVVDSGVRAPPRSRDMTADIAAPVSP